MLVIGGDPTVNQLIRGALISMGQPQDAIVAIDWAKTPKDFDAYSPKILLRFEGPTSSPLSYTSKYVGKFDRVLDVGSSHLIPWPVSEQNFKHVKQNVRKCEASMILGNKLSFSATEQYSLRRRLCLDSTVAARGTGWGAHLGQKLVVLAKTFVIGMFAQNLDLRAGRYWLRRFPNSASPVKDKWSCASKYRVALVIENDTSRVTEKLFDALAAGCRVVYVGASLDGINNEILERVQVCAPDFYKIKQALKTALEEEWVPPSEGHISALKFHYDSATGVFLNYLSSEISSARN